MLSTVEQILRQKSLVADESFARLGLGYYPKPLQKREEKKREDRKHCLQYEARVGVNENRTYKMVALSQLGAWEKWETEKQKMSGFVSRMLIPLKEVSLRRQCSTNYLAQQTTIRCEILRPHVASDDRSPSRRMERLPKGR